MMKFNIAIRFTNTNSSAPNITDLVLPLTVNLDKDDINKLVSINWLKNSIRSSVEYCKDRRLRLIYNGRVLNENTDFKNEIFQSKIRQIEEEHLLEDGDKIFIHCVVGEVLAPEQLAKENQLDNRPQERTSGPEVIGFDRLLLQGFTQEDVNDLRRQFLMIYGLGSTESRNDQINDLEEEELAQRNIRLMEERWIDSTVNESNRGAPQAAVLNQNEDPLPPPQPLNDVSESRGNEDLLLGLLVGVFLGVLGLLFVLGDNTVFNGRQKMSIISGVFLNFSFAFVRGLWI